MLGSGPALWPAQDSHRRPENTAGDTPPSRVNGVTRKHRVRHQSTVPVETPAVFLWPRSSSSFLRPQREHRPRPHPRSLPPSGAGLWVSGVGWSAGESGSHKHTHISTRTSSGRPKPTRRKQRLSSRHRTRASRASAGRKLAWAGAQGVSPGWPGPTLEARQPGGSAREPWRAYVYTRVCMSVRVCVCVFRGVVT